MYQKLDSALSFTPEKHPPKTLDECFSNEKSGIRSVAGIKVLSLIAIKSLVIIAIISFIINK